MSIKKNCISIFSIFLTLIVAVMFLASGGCKNAKKSAPAKAALPALPVERPVKYDGKTQWMEWGRAAFETAKKENKLLFVCMSPWGVGYSECDKLLNSNPRELEKSKKRGFIPVFVDIDRRPDVYIAFGAFGFLLCEDSYSPPSYIVDNNSRIVESIYSDETRNGNIYLTMPTQFGYCEGGGCCVMTDSFVCRETNVEPRANFRIKSGADLKGKIGIDEIDTLMNSCVKTTGKDIRNIENPDKATIDYDEQNMYYLWLKKQNQPDENCLFDYTDKIIRKKYDAEWGGVFFARVPASYVKYLEENARAILLNLSNHQSIRNTPADSKEAEKIIKYTLDYLSAPGGGFYGGQAQDLQGADGKALKGKEYYSLNDEQRKKIGMPERDKAIYIDKNSEMVIALLRAADVLGKPNLRKKGLETLDYLLNNGWTPEKGATHYILNGRPNLYGLIDDNVVLLRALIDAYEATGDNKFKNKALLQAELIERRYWDASRGAYKYDINYDPGLKQLLLDYEKSYFKDTNRTYIRRDEKNNMKMAMNLDNLYYITGDESYKKKSETVIKSYINTSRKDLYSSAIFIEAAYRHATYPLHITIIGPKSDKVTAALRHEARKFYEPLKVVETLDPKEDAKRLSQLPYRAKPEPTLYACVETACSMPIKDPKMVERQLRRFDDRFMGNSQFERQF